MSILLEDPSIYFMGEHCKSKMQKQKCKLTQTFLAQQLLLIDVQSTCLPENEKASRTEGYGFEMKKMKRKKKKIGWVGILLTEKKRILITVQYASRVAY